DNFQVVELVAILTRAKCPVSCAADIQLLIAQEDEFAAHTRPDVRHARRRHRGAFYSDHGYRSPFPTFSPSPPLGWKTGHQFQRSRNKKRQLKPKQDYDRYLVLPMLERALFLPRFRCSSMT